MVILEATDPECAYTRRERLYQTMSVVVVTYSITDAHTLRHAKWILGRARELESKAQIFLVGLMADCEEDRVVSSNQGEELAREFSVYFRELSAAVDEEGVERLFVEVAKFLVPRDKPVKQAPRQELGVWGRLCNAVNPWS
ncbi:hypothetical protein BJX64DRAFT_284909 [Aspergillus heterothallicus]